MTKRFASIAVLLGFLTACGPSSEELAQREAELEAIKAQQLLAAQYEDCVRAAVGTMHNTDTLDEAYQNLKGANLELCPNDFSAAFLDFVGKLEFAMGKLNEVQAHAAKQEDAMVSGALVTGFEAIVDGDTGVTPYANWEHQRTELNRELGDAADAVMLAQKEVMVEAARYGVVEPSN